MADDMFRGGAAQPADERVADAAERAVQIAAALAYVDQARHLLDGQHDSCQVCRSTTQVRTVPDPADPDGAVHTEVLTIHQPDCPVRALQSVWERLTWLFQHDC